MNFLSFYCPVPLEQRPIYEYVKVKNTWFLKWPILSRSEYTSRILFTFFFFFIFNLPIIVNFFFRKEYFIQFLFYDTMFCLLQLIFLFTYIVINWLYVKTRLESPTIFYEESSWYDGKIWVKPASVLRQEQLIAYYQISPLLMRVKKILQFLLICLIVNALIVYLL